MNIVILGGKSGLGEYMARFFSRSSSVVALGRPEIDFRGGWIKRVRDAVDSKFGDPSKVDVWVINAYDHHSEHSQVQENILNSLWPVLQKYNTAIVVIGSMAHYYQDTVYSRAKKALMHKCAQFALVPSTCRLILIEPFVLENMRARYPNSQWMKFETLCQHLDRAISDVTDNAYTHLALIGKEKPLPVERPTP